MWIIKLLVIAFIATVLIAMTPTVSKAQMQHSGYVFMANSDTTFGWYNPFWTKYVDTASFIMTTAKAKSSIDSLSLLINAKRLISDTVQSIGTATRNALYKAKDSVVNLLGSYLLTSNFTKAAIMALGIMAYTDTTALSNRINTKQNAIALTTTGTGAATLTSNTLNIPTPSAAVPLYNVSGLLSNGGKLFTDTISVSSATPTVSFSSYLSAMGTSNFKLVSVTGYRSGATTSNSPNVAVTALTSNSASFIINQTNTATVSIVGINVLSGLPTILTPDPTNIKLVISFVGY